MGFHVAYAAFRGIEKSAVLERLQLKDTGEPDPDQEEEFSGGELAGGWYLVWSNDLGWGLDHALFQSASAEGEAILAIVEETTMTFMTCFFSKGEKVWSVLHNGQEGVRHLEVEGHVPAPFEEIKERVAALQDEEDADDDELGGADMFAEIPPALFASITGFSHDGGGLFMDGDFDEDPEEHDEDDDFPRFTVLEEI